MNYLNYERQIVEKYSVELTGWPIHGPICNPGKLDSADLAILRRALVDEVCKWRKLTEEEAKDRETSNQQRAACGEPVYGPDQKKCCQNVHVIDNDMQVDNHVIDENTD
jgi:hypothetical protein